jgi:PPE-repeat protein
MGTGKGFRIRRKAVYRLNGGEIMKKGSWVGEGLATGLIGYVTVVVLFAVLNLSAGEEVFHTAAILGSALFFGAGEAGNAVGGPAPVIAYNGVHMTVSLLIGMGAAWLVFQAERNHPIWFVVFFIFLAGFIFSIALVGVFLAELAGLLSWPAILVANLAAGVTAGGFLWWRHVQLLVELAEED